MKSNFGTKEQTEHRKAFIEECMQNAWGAACHAGFIEKNLNENIADYQKLQAEDKELEKEIQANADGLDGHTVANRNKRAELQKKRNDIGQTMKLIAKNTQQGAESMQKLLTSKEQNLMLAEHAKDWSWPEPVEKAEKPKYALYILQKDWADRKAGETLTREEIGNGQIYKDLIAKGVIIEN